MNKGANFFLIGTIAFFVLFAIFSLNLPSSGQANLFDFLKSDEGCLPKWFCKDFDTRAYRSYTCQVVREADCERGEYCKNGACIGTTLTTCGNGRVDLGEECDDGGLCSDNGQNCSTQYLGRCADPTTAKCDRQNGDGCDTNCKIELTPLYVCGNGEVEWREECDDGNENPADECSNSCDLTVCGDGIKQNPNGEGLQEQCDQDDLGNQTCQSQGFSGGLIACYSDCLSFNTSECEFQDRDFDPTVSGFVPELSGGITASLDGDTVYSGGKNFSLITVDVSDPENIKVLSALPGSSANNLAVFEETVVTVNDTEGMQVFDVSNPLEPELIASKPFNAHRVVVSENIAFLLLDVDRLFGELRTVNLSDPTNPMELDVLSIPADFLAASSNGNWVYLVDPKNQFIVVNASNPNNLQIETTLTLEGMGPSSYDLTINKEETLAFIARGFEGVQIVNIENPQNPYVVSDILTTYPAMNVKSAGNGMVIVNELISSNPMFKHLYFFDVTNPLNPQEKFVSAKFDEHNSFDVVQNKLFVFGKEAAFTPNTLAVGEFTNSELTYLGEHVSSIGSFTGVSCDGDTCISTNKGSSFTHPVIDISEPLKPRIISSIEAFRRQETMGVTLDYPYAYITTLGAFLSYLGNLYIIDVSSPENPFIAKKLAMDAEQIVLSEDKQWGFAAANEEGLKVISLSNPANASVVQTLDTQGTAHGLAIDKTGNNLIIANGNNQLPIIDISTPETTTIVGSITLPPTDTAKKIVIKNDYAFITTSTYKLKIVDITDLTNPIILDTTLSSVKNVRIEGNLIFIAKTNTNTEIYEWQEPPNFSSPQTTLVPPFSGTVFEISQDRAVFATRSSPLVLYDLYKPGICGDGTLSIIGGEVCDCGPDKKCGTTDDQLNGQTCQTQNAGSGNLYCNPNCTEFNTNECS